MEYSLLQNMLLGLTLAAPIGPVNLEIIKRGLKEGFRQAFLTGAGAMCADETYLTLIFFGLTSFLNITFMKIFLGIAVSIILIYLGTVSVKEFFRNTATGNAPRRLFKSVLISTRAVSPCRKMSEEFAKYWGLIRCFSLMKEKWFYSVRQLTL